MRDVIEMHDEGWNKTGDRKFLYQDPTTFERKIKLERYLAGLEPGSKVLDYGCGRAEFTVFLSSLGFNASGLDLSSSAIEFNRTDFPELNFVKADSDRPAPLGNGVFDAIWCSEVIEHVYDVHGIFAELSRLLRVGGLLIVTTPYHGLLKNLLLVLFAFERHFNVEWQHIRFWTKRSLASVARDHSFRPIVWDSIGRIPLFAKSFFVVFERVSI